MTQNRAVPASLGYLSSTILPLGTLAFLVTAPHRWDAVIPVVIVTIVMIGMDRTGPMERSPDPAPSRLFGVLLSALASSRWARPMPGTAIRR